MVAWPCCSDAGGTVHGSSSSERIPFPPPGDGEAKRRWDRVSVSPAGTYLRDLTSSHKALLLKVLSPSSILSGLISRPLYLNF